MSSSPLATAPDDYTALSDLLLVFTETNQMISQPISIVSDGLLEDTESFQAILTAVSPVGRVTVDPALATVNILDSDGKQPQIRACCCIALTVYLSQV